MILALSGGAIFEECKAVLVKRKEKRMARSDEYLKIAMQYYVAGRRRCLQLLSLGIFFITG
jgi:hypothetical protein